MTTQLKSFDRSNAFSATHHASRILVIGAQISGEQKTAGQAVSTGSEAKQILRRLKFDLVLICSTIPDMSAWDMAGIVRRYWPWQKWMLIAPDMTADEQARALELGASGVFDSFPSLDEIFRGNL